MKYFFIKPAVMTTHVATKTKYVYSFGGATAEGDVSMKNLLGGKGANLAEMAGHPDLLLPVPPGFTLSTEVCTYYYDNELNYPKSLQQEVADALANLEQLLGKRYGDPTNPLLLSIRSGARMSMPGMMDTVLNIGLNEQTLSGLISQTGDGRFAYDAYRRLIMMYADVVMEKAAGRKPAQGKGIRKILDEMLEAVKTKHGYVNDTELTVADLQQLIELYKDTVVKELGKPFPEDPIEQLWGGIGAVFRSWNGKRAQEYRRIEGIPDEWGTAVNVQVMVFGNMGENCATGVAFTRNPGTGENNFYGEFLLNAQGEDVVAGIRTPQPINSYSTNSHSAGLSTLEELMPEIYQELHSYQKRLETHYRDMQDIEFTIEKGKLYMLQCRVGKRNGTAAVRMAAEMYSEGLIDAETTIMRVKPNQLVELLLPQLDSKAEAEAEPIAKGLPAGPGGAKGKVVFTAKEAIALKERGESVILVREETSPEDVDGMFNAAAVLTSKGGMTSHAALVTRGWGKCCIVGCNEIEVNEDEGNFRTASGAVVKAGEWISLNGAKGTVYLGELPVMAPDLESNQSYRQFMELVTDVKQLGVRTNADTPHDAALARRFGAEGIGLVRTEHMFYGEGSEEPLFLLRKMILSQETSERKAALDELFTHVKADYKGILEAMDGLPVTIRLLDPPLHEFVPHDKENIKALAKELGIRQRYMYKRVLALHENNPMLGHRGVRLGVSYPEITDMQIRAILQAAAELKQEGKDPHPEIMVPVTCAATELAHQRKIVDRVYEEVCRNYNIDKISFLYGTMIETPRAALRAAELARETEFFSFGTNDLTQMSFGFSRDDIGGFLPKYIALGLLPADPFQTLDQAGVGELVRDGIERGRAARPGLKTGICGEHGGDPASVEFCHRAGLDYVSCSPYRVPLARLAAAQAVIKERN